ncbi:MAG: hypothetical protein C4576_33860 [Desulfobacteraceae bacterium]|nr:MAG: hypothetical protein C4576_33860 [Desulfobacteraceae bacterium]
MRKTRIGKALNELIDERRGQGAVSERLAMGRKMADSDGPDVFAVDIGSIRVLTGLNILAESIIKAIIDRSVFGRSDILIEQSVDPDLQPELYKAGVANLAFTTRLTVIEDLPQFYTDIGFQIRYMLNAIQNDAIYSALLPETGEPPRGILFPFHREDDSDLTGFFYLLEYVPSGRFLRITLESVEDSRLRMTRIPHVAVESIDLIHTRVDIPGAAAMLAQGLLESCIHQRWNYIATAAHVEDLIHFLQKAGLADIEVISFSWPAEFRKETLSTPKNLLYGRIIRILYLLGDSTVTARLLRSMVVKLKDEGCCCFLDLSQRNRCLNLSFLSPRKKTVLEEYLKRMPAVLETSASGQDVFRNVRVLLVHHLTSEVLGFLQAMVDMGALQVDTLWVKYAGVVEPSYKEVMLSLPENIFRFRGVTPVLDSDGFRNRFLLSEEFTPPEDLAPLAALLREKPCGFLDAMRNAAGHLLFKAIVACRKEGSRLVIVEDGGYIAPIVNRLCLENRTVKEAARFFGFPESELSGDDLGAPLGSWIRDALIGTVEHTRNGYDALLKVEREFRSLAFPAVSIAVSDFKVNRESGDVVYSCLNGVENVMSGTGFSLSERTALVLGAQGALGRKAMRILYDRIGPGRLFGVDIVRPPSPPEWTHAADLPSLPQEALGTIDFVLGLIGISICTPEWLERLIVSTSKRDIFFASGSTKTVEFAHLTDWISACMQNPRPKLGGLALGLEFSEIYDPKTGVHQGRTVHLSVGEKKVLLHLLADLMPVNFLYYGVPSETMNHVMNELLRISAELVRRHKTGSPLPPRLLALDHEISFSAGGTALTVREPVRPE